MIARAPIEDDDEAEEPAVEHDDDTQRRASFFASAAVLDADLRDYAAWIEIEEADEAVCARVWEIFAKDSTARGFDARSARSKRASAAMAARRERDGIVVRAPAPVDLTAVASPRTINEGRVRDTARAVAPALVEIKPANVGSLRSALRWADDSGTTKKKAKVEMGRRGPVSDADGLTDKQRNTASEYCKEGSGILDLGIRI